MAGPAFGSPEWDAKYGIKRFQKGSAPSKMTKPAAALQSEASEDEPTKAPKKKRHGRGRLKGKHDPKNFIASAIKHPGALHEDTGTPMGQKIPMAKMEAASHMPGKEGQRARFALMLKKLNRG